MSDKPTFLPGGVEVVGTVDIITLSEWDAWRDFAGGQERPRAGWEGVFFSWLRERRKSEPDPGAIDDVLSG